jgi:hypothetical protein
VRGYLLPVTRIDIEVAAFDIQKIKNPDVSGIGYQNGVQKDTAMSGNMCFIGIITLMDISRKVKECGFSYPAPT